MATGGGGSSGGSIATGGDSSTDGGESSTGGTQTGAAGAEGGVGPMPDATRETVLAAVAACTVERLETFAVRARALADAAGEHSAAQTEERANALRAAWSSAIDVWEELELFQFGPAGSSGMTGTPGGRDLRPQIYAWPQFFRCTTEQQLVSERYLRADFPGTLEATRGLGAIEYLAFYSGTDNECPSGNSINTSGSWAALLPDELPRRKAAYAEAAARDLAARADALLELWDDGRFADELRRAGAGSDTYPTLKSAIDAVGNALFYVDTEVKDMKLAEPLGIAAACADKVCPVVAESPFAGRSKQHVANNLRGFRSIVFGCGSDGRGLAFDDLLVAMGAGRLAGDMHVALDDALAAVDALEEPSIEAAIAADRPSVEALHGAVKRVTDLLKIDFITVLDIDLSQDNIGDND